MFVNKACIDKHTYQIVNKNRLASSTWIATRLANDLRNYLDLDLKMMRNIFEERDMTYLS